ncbi:MAG: C4-type zinc ribbon domain-containing protein [bacterium]|nr:C4-type zinc ribbon domain-containing protein [bacterium]
MSLSDELQKLWEVQLLDVEIMSLEERFQNLDRGEELKKKIDSLINLYNKKSEEIRSKEISLKEFELELSSLEERKRKDEERLYKNVTTQKEVDRITQEIQYINQEKSKLEDKILEIMESLDSLREEIPKIKKEIEDLEISLTEITEKARVFEREILERLQDLKNKRSEKINGIDSKLLSRYEMIRKNRRGRGMSKVMGEKCSECGVELSLFLVERLKQLDELITCEHCGRILFWENS